MCNEHTPAVGVRCPRCSGTSTVVLKDPTTFTSDREWACPHCCRPETRDGIAPLSDYDFMAFKIVSEDVDSVHSIEEYDHDTDVATENQRGHFEAVVIHGQSHRERGAEAGVSHGTVGTAVHRVRKKLRGENKHAKTATACD